MGSAHALLRAALALGIAAMCSGKVLYWCLPGTYVGKPPRVTATPKCRSIPGAAFGSHPAPKLDQAAVSCNVLGDNTVATFGLCKGKAYNIQCKFKKPSHALITSVGYTAAVAPAAGITAPALGPAVTDAGLFNTAYKTFTTIWNLPSRKETCLNQRLVVQKLPAQLQTIVTFSFTVPCRYTTTKWVRLYISSSSTKTDWFHTTAVTYKIRPSGCTPACAGR